MCSGSLKMKKHYRSSLSPPPASLPHSKSPHGKSVPLLPSLLLRALPWSQPGTWTAGVSMLRSFSAPALCGVAGETYPSSLNVGVLILALVPAPQSHTPFSSPSPSSSENTAAVGTVRSCWAVPCALLTPSWSCAPRSLAAASLDTTPTKATSDLPQGSKSHRHVGVPPFLISQTLVLTTLSSLKPSPAETSESVVSGVPVHLPVSPVLLLSVLDCSPPLKNRHQPGLHPRPPLLTLQVLQEFSIPSHGFSYHLDCLRLFGFIQATSSNWELISSL